MTMTSQAKRKTSNVFAIARHNADNTQIVVSRNGRAPFIAYRIADLPVTQDSALSIVAVQQWLADKGIAATAIELESKPTLATSTFPYAVKVRAMRGIA